MRHTALASDARLVAFFGIDRLNEEEAREKIKLNREFDDHMTQQWDRVLRQHLETFQPWNQEAWRDIKWWFGGIARIPTTDRIGAE